MISEKCRAWSRKISIAVVLAGLLISGCSDPQTSSVSSDETVSTVTKSKVEQQATISPEGTSTTLDFATWNLEWFGDTENGPSDEQLQLENVQTVISGLDMDLWSVQEVTSTTHFNNLLSSLSGYDGFLANDSSVENGPEYYSDYDNNELKVGLIYKTDLISVNSARVILTSYDYEFAGRPPVEVQLTATVDGVSKDIVVILLHAKAGSGSDDWERRNQASIALKTYMDDNWPTTTSMVIGDFNDDVDESITNKPMDSPYKNFADDTVEYIFPTEKLSNEGVSSTVYYSDMIDHHLNTNELNASYVDGTVQVFPANDYIADYDQTTSDHYPVLSNYSLSGDDGGDTNSAPTASFTYSTTDLIADFDGSGSSDSDGSISDYSWDFGDGNTGSGSTVSHTYSSEGTYTVTLTVTDDEGATGSESQDVAVSESTTEEISLTATGYKSKGLQKVDLNWSGATSTDVDVYRDGSVIITTLNDGEHIDNIDQRGGGSYSYKLCESGTTSCSNEATVTF
jgi:PKD repeat protein